MSENRFRVNHGVVNVGELAQCVGIGKLQLDPQRTFVKRIDANLGRVINPTTVVGLGVLYCCLLYTSDAADDASSV